MKRWLTAVAFIGITAAAFGEIRVDRASVTVERRGGQDWCVLDAQVSGPIEAGVETVAAVIQNYSSYPHVFPHIREAAIQQDGMGLLLSETVVVNALGIQNINRFTVRVQAGPTERGFRLTWVQQDTDGTIDGLEGEWLLERKGTAEKPMTWVTYRTKSSVLKRVFGQEFFMRMFLGGETKAVVEALGRQVRAGIR